MADDLEEAELLKLLGLFTVRRKRDLVRHARSVVIRTGDFVKVVEWCHLGLLRFNHGAHYHHNVPEHLVPSEADLDVLAGRPPSRGRTPTFRKTMRKVGQFMHESGWTAGHMFCTPELDQWHFFVFGKTHEDDRRNHWREGPHAHFINWLWPHMDPRKVWYSFADEGKWPSSAIHVRHDPGAA